MRSPLLLLALAAACGSPGSRAADAGMRRDTLDIVVPRDSADSVLHTPRLVASPAVIVFWLAAGDTLPPDDAAAAFDELTAATEHVVPLLAAYDIQLLPTNAETVYVALPNRRRRAIPLSGLEFPFGYLLVEPGGVERVLAGAYGEDELMEEIRVFFDLPDSAAAAMPKVVS